MRSFRILEGDALSVLRTLPDESVHCCVTSPPYWGLRDYGVVGQMGNEPTPEAFVAGMVAVFAEVRRVLRSDGNCWVNLGDSYAGSSMSGGVGSGTIQGTQQGAAKGTDQRFAKTRELGALKPKDLVGIPWRVAFALQADGWYLRSDIIWSKPNPMPESVTDRPTKAHEYLFLLAKSERYYYDAAAIAEPVALSQVGRVRSDVFGGTSWKQRGQHSIGGTYGTTRLRSEMPAMWSDGPDSGLQEQRVQAAICEAQAGPTADREGLLDVRISRPGETRNKRSVWTLNTEPFPEAHFATFPTALVEPCVLAGSPEGGVVLDPFAGSGTTGVVALRHDREFIGIELNPVYAQMARNRITQDAPMFNEEMPAMAQLLPREDAQLTLREHGRLG